MDDESNNPALPLPPIAEYPSLFIRDSNLAAASSPIQHTNNEPQIPEMQFKCKYCFKLNRDTKVRDRHEMEVHNKPKTGEDVLGWYRCRCGKSFNYFRKTNYNRHLRVCRTEKWVFPNYHCQCGTVHTSSDEHKEHYQTCRSGRNRIGRPHLAGDDAEPSMFTQGEIDKGKIAEYKVSSEMPGGLHQLRTDCQTENVPSLPVAPSQASYQHGPVQIHEEQAPTMVLNDVENSCLDDWKTDQQHPELSNEMLERHNIVGSKLTGDNIDLLLLSNTDNTNTEIITNGVDQCRWGVSQDGMESEETKSQVSAGSTIQDSIFDTQSLNSINTSSTSNSILTLEARERLIGAFVELLLEVDDLANKIELALQQDGFDQMELLKVIRMHLKLFARSLGKEVPGGIMAKAVLFFRTQATLIIIPGEIVRCAAKLNRKSRKGQNKSGPQLDLGSDSEQDSDYQSDTDSEPLDIEELAGIDLVEIRRALASSSCFHTLVRSIYDFVNPTFGSRVRKLLDRRYTLRNLPIPPSIQLVVSELLYSRPAQLELSKSPVGNIDQAKSFVETTSGREWDWWPLLAPQRSLEDNEVRITWLCKCGKRRQANLPEKLARGLASLIESNRDMTATHSHDEPGPSNSAIRGGNNHLPQLQSYHMGPVEGPLAHKPTTAYEGICQEEKRTGTDIARRFVLSMVSVNSIWSGKALLLDQIESQDVCDGSFFNELRRSYFKRRGWLRRFLGFDTFSHCEFYEFEVYKAHRFAQREKGLPLGRNPQYYFKRCEPPPPVSPEEFLDRFWNSGSCAAFNCRCGDEDVDMEAGAAVERIPQKVGGIEPSQKKGRPRFWGIVAREKRSALRVLVYVLICASPNIVSVWFFFSWLFAWGHEGELQNAAVPAELSLTLFAVLFTMLMTI